MSRNTAAIWGQARTMADVGELTAQWLEGRIASGPAYFWPVDVDEHLAPGMTETLIALNRAWMVTDSSQGGHDGDFQQQAAVSGYASLDAAARVRAALAQESGLVFVDLRQGGEAPVGWYSKANELRDDWVGYGVCHPDAVEALIAAEQVVIYDPEFGRNDRLWPALRRLSLVGLAGGR